MQMVPGQAGGPQRGALGQARRGGGGGGAGGRQQAHGVPPLRGVGVLGGARQQRRHLARHALARAAAAVGQVLAGYASGLVP